MAPPTLRGVSSTAAAASVDAATSGRDAGTRPRPRPLDGDAFALDSGSDSDTGSIIRTPDKDDDEDEGEDDDDDDAIPSERQGLVGHRSPEDLVANDDDGDDRNVHPDLKEPDLSVRQAVRVYRKAIFWCIATSACVIMEGYDTIL